MDSLIVQSKGQLFHRKLTHGLANQCLTSTHELTSYTFIHAKLNRGLRNLLS